VVMTRDELLKEIETSRERGGLTGDQARAASLALGLEGDEAMLAVRLLGQGSDPASLEYVAQGAVSDMVARAHREGPGVYEDQNSDQCWHYLLLCGVSADEASPPATLRARLLQLAGAVSLLRAPRAEFPNKERCEALVASERKKIVDLPYALLCLHGIPTQLYVSDRGFAAAYWSGREHAATFNEDPRGNYVAVGTRPGTTLAQVGIPVDKKLSPSFGLIFQPQVLGEARVLTQALRKAALEPAR